MTDAKAESPCIYWVDCGRRDCDMYADCGRVTVLKKDIERFRLTGIADCPDYSVNFHKPIKEG